MEMSGVMKDNLPFKLPSTEEIATGNTSQDNSLLHPVINKSSNNLEQMEKKTSKEKNSLSNWVNGARKAHWKRRLTKFPKPISQWRPQEGKLEAQAEEVLLQHSSLGKLGKVFHTLLSQKSACGLQWIHLRRNNSMPGAVLIGKRMP